MQDRLIDRIKKERDDAIETAVEFLKSGDQAGVDACEKDFYKAHERLLSVAGINEEQVKEDVKLVLKFYKLKGREYVALDKMYGRLIKIAIFLWVTAVMILLFGGRG